MSVDRDKSNATKASVELLNLVQALEKYHRVGEMIDRYNDETKGWNDAEIDECGENAAPLM